MDLDVEFGVCVCVLDLNVVTVGKPNLLDSVLSAQYLDEGRGVSNMSVIFKNKQFSSKI